MLLSIIVPVYNTSQYLEGCIRSITANDCSDCEIILVDDGATDGICPAMCNRLAAGNPGLIRVIHQQNQGVGSARNTGIESARGEYLFFPDSDDTITSNALSVLKKAICETRADVVAFNLYSDDGQGKYTPIDANYIQPEGVFTAAEKPEFLLSLPSAWSRVWKRSLFMDAGIRYPSRVWYEDLRTSMKLFVLAQSIVAIPDRLYLYLQRPGSIMRSTNVDRNREIIDAFQDLLTWFREQGLWETFREPLCRLCVDHLYIAASVRVLRADPRHRLLAEFQSYLQENFPNYQENPLLSQLSFPHKLALRLLDRKHYRLLKWLFGFMRT